MNCSTVGPTCTVFSSTNLTAYGKAPMSALTVCVLTSGVLFGLPTHCYVIWLIITGTGNGFASEFFNLNISVCEIIFCAYTLMLLVYSHNQSQKEYLLLVLRFLTGDILTTRPLFQCLICVERYLAVVHPVTFLKYKPLRYRVICCSVVWIIGLGFCFFCLFILASSVIIFMWMSFLQFLIFFLIQLFCLVAVLRALKQSGPGERGREREEENPVKRRAFKIIAILTLTTLIIFAIFIISRFLNILLQKEVEEVSFFSMYFFVLGSFIPSLLYLWRVGKLPFFKPP